MKRILHCRSKLMHFSIGSTINAFYGRNVIRESLQPLLGTIPFVRTNWRLSLRFTIYLADGWKSFFFGHRLLDATTVSGHPVR